MQYWKAFYHGNHYWPVGGGFVLLLDGDIGYGKTYGKDKQYALPFWENFYAGGVRTCAATRTTPWARAPMCPTTVIAQPIGGAFKVKGTAQVFLPIPALRDVSTARVAAFVDFGNVYKSYNTFNATGAARLLRHLAAVAGADRPAGDQLCRAVPQPAPGPPLRGTPAVHLRQPVLRRRRCPAALAA